MPAICQQIRKEKIDSIDALFHGWDIDSTYTPQGQDSLEMKIDYWEAKAWIELMGKPDEYYCAKHVPGSAKHQGASIRQAMKMMKNGQPVSGRRKLGCW